MPIIKNMYRCNACNRIDFFEPNVNACCPKCGEQMSLIEANVQCRTDEEIAADPLPVYDIFGDPSSPFYVPKATCPYCHSKNTQKINLAEKALNTAVFGIFGTKRHKQWHCNQCKSDF